MVFLLRRRSWATANSTTTVVARREEEEKEAATSSEELKEQGGVLPGVQKEEKKTAEGEKAGEAEGKGETEAEEVEEADEDGEKRCRLCYGGEEDGPLVQPCACRGSIRWIHEHCLTKWRCTSTNEDAAYRCGQCSTETHSGGCPDPNADPERP